MPRLSQERVAEIMKSILDAGNDVTVLTPLLQELKDDYANIDILIEQSTIKVGEQTNQLKDLKQKYYDTFVNGNSSNETLPSKTEGEEVEEILTPKSFDELILEID